MERINLVDMNFNSFSRDEKRLSFITMDMVMKNLHEKNKMVTSFKPQDISYYTASTLFEFDKVSDIDTLVSNSKEEAIRNNIIELSTLAFCSYLKTYDPKNGLLNNDVIASEFDKFTSNFNEDDVEYYRKVLVDGYKNKSISEPIYYSDALIEKESKKSGSGEKGIALVRATEVGKAMAEPNQEAAFSTQFALICMVASTVLFVVGYIIYLLSIF